MKTIRITILFALFLLGSFNAFSQTSHIHLGAYTNNSGRNVVINFGWNFENSSLDLGVKYLFRNAPYDSAGHLYYRRFYPETFVEHWGLNFMYRYYFHLPKIDNNLFVFTNLQSTRAGVRNTIFLSSNDQQSDTVVEYKFDNVCQLENNIGIGFRARVTEKLSMHLGCGGGVSLIFNERVKTSYVLNGNLW
ncbi:MAG: hypothetical protein DWQ02_18170 [Bacteroidetes bacterium]|nr:MAG: hypothetical protein DWQ02_18170 [Bacteroidota bacterium]